MQQHIICIDPGHGGRHPGRVTYLDDPKYPSVVKEKDVVLDIAHVVAETLREQGVDVRMTRTEDRTLGLTARANYANRIKANYFVSIHLNAAATYHATGQEVWIYPGSNEGYALADYVLDAIHAYGHNNRGIRESSEFTVLAKTRMPAILVECEFMHNKEMCKWILDNYRLLGIGIAQGVLSYLIRLEP